MDRVIFDEVVRELPLLTAEGFAVEGAPDFDRQRAEFLEDERYPAEMGLVRSHLQDVPKSQRFSEWQRQNCDPSELLEYFAFRLGRRVSVGSIVAAAVSLGFTMGVHEGRSVYFNFSAETIETGLAELRSRDQVEKIERI